MSFALDRKNFPTRLYQARIEVYGENGVSRLAKALGIPPATWRNYESGVSIPGLTLLMFVHLTGVDVRWLMAGEGVAFPHPDARSGLRAVGTRSHRAAE